jgi:hypothetical protein
MTFTENAAASLALACQVSGDTNPRVTLGADGKLNWGPGNGATDLNLYRNAANTLKTDFSFVATGSVRTGNVVTVGGTTSLGDNGAGELQITDVTTKPTTNPTAGVSVYSQSATSVPLKLRDTAGSVRGLVRSFALATGDQTSVSTTQTASTFLTAAVEANATYLMECWIYWTTANSATVTTSWSTTATGSTMIWNDTTTGGDIVTTLTGVSPAWTTGTKQIFLKGVLLTAGTPGNLTFTIASNVSASVTIKANGSALMLERVA